MERAWQKTMERERSAERGAGVTKIGWSAELLFRRSYALLNAHMLWSLRFKG